MALQIVYGDIPVEAVSIITEYKDKYLSTYEMVDLSTIARVKNYLRVDCMQVDKFFIVVSEHIANANRVVAKELFESNKVFVYDNEEGLRNFLNDFLSVSSVSTVEAQGTDEQSSGVSFDNDMVFSDDTNDYENEIREKDAEIAELKKKLSEVNVSSSDTAISERIAELEHEVEAKSELARNLNSEVFLYKEKAIKFDTIFEDYTALKSTKQTMESDIQKLTDANNEYKTKLESALTDVQQYEKKVSELEDVEDRANAKILSLSDLISQKDDENKSLAEQITELKQASSDREALSKRVQVLEEKRRNLTEENAKLTDSINTLSEIKSKYDTLQIDYTASQADNLELTEQIATLTTEKETAVDKVAKLTETISENKGIISEKEDELKKLKSSLDAITEEKIKLSEDLDNLMGDYNTAVSERDTAQASVTTLTKTKESLTQEVDTLRSEVSDKEAKLQSKCTELTNSENLAEQYKQKNTELNSSIESFKISVKEKSNTINELKGKLLTEEGRVKNLNDELATLRSNNAVSNTELQNKITELSEKVSNLEGSNQTLQGTYDNLLSESETLRTSLSDKTAEYAALKDSYESLLSEHRASIDSIKMYESKSKDFEAQKNIVSANAEEIEKLKAEYDTVQTKLREEEERSTKLMQALKNASAKIASLQNDLSAERDKNAIEAAVQNTSSDNTRINDLEVSLANEQIKVAELTERLSTVTKDVSDKEVQIKKANSELENVKKQLEISREKAQRVSELEEENNNLGDDKANLEKEVATLTQKLQDKSEEASRLSDTTAYTEKIKSLEEEVSERDRRILTLKQSDASTKNKIALLNEDIGKLRVALSDCNNNLSDAKSKLSTYENSVLTKLGNLNIAGKYTGLRIDMSLSKIYKSIYTFISASPRSTHSMYNLLAKQVENTNKSVLVLDLMTGSYSDGLLGLKLNANSSPYKWLMGIENIDSCIVHSEKYKNVSVISSALHSFKDVDYLRVDWNARLDELEKKADCVIICGGSLQNSIDCILINSFLSVMRGIMVVEYSPLDLRAAYVGLNNFEKQGTGNLTVACTQYQIKTSNTETTDKIFPVLEKNYSAIKIPKDTVFQLI